jgi:hypothetical protein
MVNYLKECEKHMLKVLNSNNKDNNITSILEYFAEQIKFIQHERLVHLIVTVAFAIFLLLSVFITLYSKIMEFAWMDLLFFVLLVPYIAHYYRLENGVQRLYKLYNQIYERYNEIK